MADEEIDDEEDEFQKDEEPLNEVQPKDFELQVSELIDEKYRDKHFAEKNHYFSTTKLDKRSITEVKIKFEAEWELYHKRALDDIRGANKHKETVAREDARLLKYTRDSFLMNWMSERNLVVDYLTSAVASCLQMMTYCSYLFPKLMEEQQKVYKIGPEQYRKQELVDRFSRQLVEAMATGAELGIDLKKKAVEARAEKDGLDDAIKVLNMTRADARMEGIVKEFALLVLKKTNFQKQIYPTTTDCYRELHYARNDLVEAKNLLVQRGFMREESKGRGHPTYLIPLMNQYVLEKTDTKVGDKYRNSRENPPPAVQEGPFSPEGSRNEEPYEVVQVDQDAENPEPPGQ